MTTPSAPFPIARIIKEGVTLPEQLILTGLKVEGYCALIVPAMSPAPYPHFCVVFLNGNHIPTEEGEDFNIPICCICHYLHLSIFPLKLRLFVFHIEVLYNILEL
jgi:hypothetical protein